MSSVINNSTSSQTTKPGLVTEAMVLGWLSEAQANEKPISVPSTRESSKISFPTSKGTKEFNDPFMLLDYLIDLECYNKLSDDKITVPPLSREFITEICDHPALLHVHKSLERDRTRLIELLELYHDPEEEDEERFH
jgi:hypothetical protein